MYLKPKFGSGGEIGTCTSAMAGRADSSWEEDETLSIHIRERNTIAKRGGFFEYYRRSLSSYQ